MRVVFFNYFHNGDIHVSRNIIRMIMNKLPGYSFSYSHKNPPNILADISNLEFSRTGIGMISEHTSLLRTPDTLYFNTWYAQQHFKHMNALGLTFDALYAGFDENCRNAFGFSLGELSQNPHDFYPTIDYSKFEIANAKEWLSRNPERKILVENGQSLSGQSDNFNMTQAVANIAKNHMDKIFIFANQDGIPLPNNCIYAGSIIKKSQRSDLNEISYLSTHCDTIIGRASGVWTFALTQQNLFQRQPKFIGFYNLPFKGQDYWLGPNFKDKVHYSATFSGHDVTQIDKVQEIIQANL
jgi:hypothetical protein